MPVSSFTFFGGDIANGSDATPGLWNRRFSVLSQNLDQLNADAGAGVGTVNSIAGTSNQIVVSNATGNVTLSLPSVLNVPGSLSAPLLSVTNAAKFLSTVSSDGTATVLALVGVTVTGTLLTAAQPNITSVGTLSGLTVTATITGSVSGNAGTATVLATARTINGVSFDGSANITVTAAAETLTGTTLASNVVASSLTSVGTLTGLTVSGQVTSTVATGTAPLVIASTTLVTNLNADLLDGEEGSAYHAFANLTYSGLTAGQLLQATGTTSAAFGTTLTGNYTFSAAGTALAITNNLTVGGTITGTTATLTNTGALAVLAIGRGSNANSVDSAALDLMEYGNAAATAFGTADAFGFRFKYEGLGNQLLLQTGNQTTVTTRVSVGRDDGLFKFLSGALVMNLGGAAVATAGSLRFESGNAIGWRNAANSANVTLTLGDTAAFSGAISVGGTATVTGIATLAGNTIVGATTVYDALPSKPRFIVTGAVNGIAAVFAERTDNAAQKNTRIGAAHYTNAEEPMAVIFAISAVSDSELKLGGGTGVFNAATAVQIYTGATNTTLTGTLRASWNSAGTFAQVGNATIGGTTTLSGLLAVAHDAINIATFRRTTTTAGNAGIAIRVAGTTNLSFVDFGDSASQGVGSIQYSHNSDSFAFTAGGTSNRFTLTSAGNATFAGSLTATTISGTAITGTGLLSISAAADHTIERGSTGTGATLVVANYNTTVSTNHVTQLVPRFADTSGTTALNAGYLRWTKEQDWTSTASTRDSNVKLAVAVNGTLTDALTITSALAATFAGSLSAQAISGTTGTFTGLVQTTLGTGQFQWQVRYDASNLFTMTVDSAGGVTYDATGSGALHQFIDPVRLTDELAHQGATAGFYNATPVAQQTGVAVTAAAIHAALVNLGLITA